MKISQDNNARYIVGNADMISIALRERGKWKLATTPLYMSANVLNYSSVSEAIDHNDALIEPATQSLLS